MVSGANPFCRLPPPPSSIQLKRTAAWIEWQRLVRSSTCYKFREHRHFGCCKAGSSTSSCTPTHTHDYLTAPWASVPPPPCPPKLCPWGSVSLFGMNNACSIGWTKLNPLQNDLNFYFGLYKVSSVYLTTIRNMQLSTALYISSSYD